MKQQALPYLLSLWSDGGTLLCRYYFTHNSVTAEIVCGSYPENYNMNMGANIRRCAMTLAGSDFKHFKPEYYTSVVSRLLVCTVCLHPSNKNVGSLS
ncbi:hypothetical protein ARMGADRAFT_308915 [Armillaria gallica]|uniref:Uncharacterized protein n=1 Tax=Armillaria gallica TaxID=47427 RepID=A0A2H3DM89_ARMGA|nr:hypothetical protein ARMGADRAFT_308915 [Armillaria gallica]